MPFKSLRYYCRSRDARHRSSRTNTSASNYIPEFQVASAERSPSPHYRRHHPSRCRALGAPASQKTVHFFQRVPSRRSQLQLVPFFRSVFRAERALPRYEQILSQVQRAKPSLAAKYMIHH